jgi:hypothetical protein
VTVAVVDTVADVADPPAGCATSTSWRLGATGWAAPSSPARRRRRLVLRRHLHRRGPGARARRPGNTADGTNREPCARRAAGRGRREGRRRQHRGAQPRSPAAARCRRRSTRSPAARPARARGITSWWRGNDGPARHRRLARHRPTITVRRPDEHGTAARATTTWPTSPAGARRQRGQARPPPGVSLVSTRAPAASPDGGAASLVAGGYMHATARRWPRAACRRRLYDVRRSLTPATVKALLT